MIIILEGENRCGKTTIADKLVKEFGYNYVHCDKPEEGEDLYISYMRILKNIEKSGNDTVIDRFLYGEFVYGPLYRHRIGLTEGQKRNLELKALSLDARIIYCDDEVENIIERFSVDKEDFAKPSLVRQTLSLYDDVIAEAILPKAFHRMKTNRDYTTGKLLEDFIIPGPYNRHMITAVGNQVNPSIVLVGEKRNTRQHTEYSRFGQPFDFGPATDHLFEQLYRAGVPENRIMLINSDSVELERLRDYDTVVALGQAADKELTRFGVRHTTVNHPSYESRFYHGQNRLSKYFRKLYAS